MSNGDSADICFLACEAKRLAAGLPVPASHCRARKVLSVGDGIVWIEGLPSASIDEVLLLEDGSRAMVFHLTEELVGAILLEQTRELTAGTIAHHSGTRLSIPCGDALLGRVVDPLGKALDGEAEPRFEIQRRSGCRFAADCSSRFRESPASDGQQDHRYA